MFQLLITEGTYVFAQWMQQPRTRAKSSLFASLFFHSLNCQSWPLTKTATTLVQRDSVKLVTLSQTSKVTTLLPMRRFTVTNCGITLPWSSLSASGSSSQWPSSRKRLMFAKETFPGTSIAGTTMTGCGPQLKSFAIEIIEVNMNLVKLSALTLLSSISLQNSFEQVPSLRRS